MIFEVPPTKPECEIVTLQIVPANLDLAYEAYANSDHLIILI